MNPKSNIESFSNTIEEKFKITELEEKFNIKVSPEDLKKYKDAIFSKKEVDKIQAWFSSVSELAKTKLAILKEKAGKQEQIKKSQEFLKNTIKNSKEESSKAVEWVTKAMEELGNSEIIKDTKEKWTELTEKTKELTKKSVETIKKSKWMISFIAWLEELKEKWGIGGFLATIMLFILWFLGFNKDKIKEKTKEKAKDVLKWKEAEKVRKAIVESIQNDLLKLKKLSPKIAEELEKILKDPNIISKENLLELQKRLKTNWKLTLLDLKFILWKEKFEKLQKDIFGPEIRKQLKAEAEKKIVDQIYATYNLDLKKDKRAELEKLVSKYIKIDNFIALDRKFKWEWVSLGDLLSLSFSEGWNIALFAIEAVGKWIIWPWKLIIYAGKKWTETISLWLAWLWIKDDIKLDKFKEEVQNMNSVERGLLLWTLYRHTGFLSTILGEIAQTSTRLLIEWMSSAPVSSTKAWWAALRWNIDKQMQVFMKLEKIFWQSAWTEAIKSSLNEIKKLKTNNEIIRLLNESNNDIKTFKNALSTLDKNKLDINIINTVKDINANSFSKLREEISNKVTTLRNTWISTTLKNTLTQLGFPLSKYEYEFYKNTDNILRYQKEAIKTWVLSKIWKFWTKLWEIQWYSNLSRDLEKLHFENLSKSQALTKMQALKKLFLDFPDLSKSFFWAVPEIAFFGLALSSKKEDESFMDAMLDTMLYMTPVVWPIKMILSARTSLNEEWVQWYNMAEAGAWVVLLWIDTSFIIKTGLGWWSNTEKVVKIWSHILKPITSPYKFWRDLVKTSINMYDIVKAEWKINWWKLSKKSIDIIKKWLKTWKTKTFILSIIAAWGYAWYELFKEDIWDEYKELMEKWIIDNQGHIVNYKKLKEEFNKMDLNEKESMIEIIFLMASVPTSSLNFKIRNNKLEIISHDENIQSDWILKDSEWKILKILDSIWFNYKNIDFKYEKLT